jgi:hypothetical protein
MRAHLTLLIALGLVACGQLPRPFAPDAPSEVGGALDAVALMGPRGSLMVTPVEGLDPDDSRALAEAIARELRKRDVAAFTRAGGRTSWLLQMAVPSPGQATWRLVDPAGRPVSSGRGAANPLTLASQVETAMAALTPALPAATRQAVRFGPVAGVGPEAARFLGMALQAELKRAGIPVVEAGPEALLLNGNVKRTDIGDGSEEIEINWTVAQPSGEEIGTIGQRNRLPKGQIDGRWPAVAGVVAIGAADGILDIVEAVEAARK